MTWPPRWTPGPHFKGGTPAKVIRHNKRVAATSKEDAQKARVRKRDGYCRFPLCGCRKVQLTLEVSHGEHKGMGGNPKGDRSVPAKMILLCAARHRMGTIAVDRGTVRIRPLNKRQGFGGPCAFDVDLPKTINAMRSEKRRWIELARESARHVFEPFTPKQEEILARLATMEL